MERRRMKGKDNGRSTKWTGESFIPLLEEFQSPIKGATFNEVGGPLFINDSTVNLSFLRASHLSEGAKIQVNGVISSSYSQDFVVAALDKIEALFMKQCRPFSVGGKLYVEVR